MRRLLILVLAAFCACGRTEPVHGLIEPDPFPPVPDAGVDAGVHGFTPVPSLDGGQIISGTCEGPFSACPRGFHCEAGQCVLNGSEGALQVTLQWQTTPRVADDLDLHLIEPATGVNSSCEIYYGTGTLFSCRPVGELDLDANAGCLDTAGAAGLAFDTENIIYPVNKTPPVGHYEVRVDYWGECVNASQVPFVVTVRKGSTITRRTGVFFRGQSDSGSQGSGVTVFEFDWP